MKKNNLALKIIAAVLAICIVLGSVSCGLVYFDIVDIPFIANIIGKQNEDSHFTNLDGKFTDIKITDEKSAIEAVASVGEQIGIENAEKDLKVESVNKIDGDSYYRMQQYYNDIPVYGRDVIVAADKDGNAAALTGNVLTIEKSETEPKISEEKAFEAVDKEYKNSEKINNGLVIMSMGGVDPQLAYQITVSGISEETDYYIDCFVSAENGKILFINDLVLTNDTYPQSAYTYRVEDNKYLMYDQERNFIVLNANKNKLKVKHNNDTEKIVQFYSDKTKEPFSNPENSYVNLTPSYEVYSPIKYETSTSETWDNKSSAYMVNLEKSYDFFEEILERTGFDDDNGTIYAVYNDNFDKGDNGYSNGNLIAIGHKKDLNETDLIAHEYTHSVEESISKMNYSGESGALMEAYSDIFGELIEDYGNDNQLNGNCNWIHGERKILNPLKSKLPAEYKGEYWADTTEILDSEGKSTNDHGGVHNNSTVISHAAYLMWNGINGTENFKIDTEKLAKLWYRALFMMPSDATFAQCAYAVETAAWQMYYDKQLTTRQVACVRYAFEKVGIKVSSSVSVKTVKNDFDLSVLSNKGTNNVHFNLEIYKYKKQGFILKRTSKKNKEKISVKNYVNGQQHLQMEDGEYLLKFTDLEENGSESKTVEIRIKVNGKSESAADNITVIANFKDVITVVVDETTTNTTTDNTSASETQSTTVPTNTVASTVTSGNKPTKPVELPKDMTKTIMRYNKYNRTIAAGMNHTVAVREDGTVVAVGSNDDGQCNVSGWKNIVAVAAGSSHTVGLKSNGTVVAVGENDAGECNVSDWKNIVAVAAGYDHTVGLKSDGTVVAVGSHSGGRACDVTDWKNIVAITAGYVHIVGLKADGTVVATGGSGVHGECSVDDWKNIVAISAKHSNTVGLKANGTVVAVGDNWWGACNVDDWKNIVAVAAGENHTVGLKADGTVVAVGDNRYGECDVVNGWTNIVAICAGRTHIVGLKSDGTVVAVDGDGYTDPKKCDVSNWRNIKVKG